MKKTGCEMAREPIRIEDIDAAYRRWCESSAAIFDHRMWMHDPRYMIVVTHLSSYHPLIVQWSFDGVHHDWMDYDVKCLPAGRVEWYLCRPAGVEEMELRKRTTMFRLPEIVCSSEPVYAVMDERFREGGGYTLRPSEIAAAEREADDTRQAEREASESRRG